MVKIEPLVFVAIFSLIFIFIGFYYRHRKHPEEFFMAGRKVGLLKVVSSIVTLLGAGEIVTLTAFAYIYGYYGISIFIGVLAGCLFMSVLVPRIRDNVDNYKPYLHTDYLRRFLGVGSEKISIILSLIAVTSLLMIQLVVGGSLISTLTGLSYSYSVIIIGLVIAIYLMLGGFNSVLTTSTIQALCLTVLLILLLIFYNPSDVTIAQLITNAQNIIPPLDFFMLFILGFFAIMGGTDVYQLIYSAKSDKVAKKSIIIAGFAFLILTILMVTLGLKIHAQLPTADPNNAFIEFLSGNLPTTIGILLSLLIMTSIFSVSDTELFLSSILVGRLVFGKKELNKKVGQLLIGIVIILGIVLSLYFSSLVDIYFALLYVFMIIGSIMIARLFGRGNDIVASISMILSLVILIFFALTDKLIGLYPLMSLIPSAINFFVPAKKLNLIS